jgi:hypothetical protein
MDLTVSDLQEQITRGKTEFEARMQELRAQPATGDLAEQIKNLQLVYHQSAVWLSTALLEAKYREKNLPSRAAKARQDAEEFARSAALASYTQAGGNPDQFDILWPEIRFDQIKKIIAQSQKPVRKPFSL